MEGTDNRNSSMPQNETVETTHIIQKEGSTKSSKKKTWVVILILILLIAVAVGIFKFLSTRDSKEESKGGAVVITQDKRVSASDVSNQIAAGMIVVKMTGEWTFKDGNSAGDGYVANSQYNSAPLKITVTLKDSEEVILETEPIPVGSCIENFPLSQDLEKGTYSAVVAHSTVDDNGEVINTVRTEVKINVLN